MTLENKAKYIVAEVSRKISDEVYEAIRYEQNLTQKQIQDEVIKQLVKYYGKELK